MINNGKFNEIKIDKNCYCVVVVERNASQHPVAMMQQNNQAPVFKSLPEAAYPSNVNKYILPEYYSQILIRRNSNS